MCGMFWSMKLRTCIFLHAQAVSVSVLHSQIIIVCMVKLVNLPLSFLCLLVHYQCPVLYEKVLKVRSGINLVRSPWYLTQRRSCSEFQIEQISLILSGGNMLWTDWVGNIRSCSCTTEHNIPCLLHTVLTLKIWRSECPIHENNNPSVWSRPHAEM